MRGFLTLEPDEATLASLISLQNRLRDAVSRQGVSFPTRLSLMLLGWPFATLNELAQAAEAIVDLDCPLLTLDKATALPNMDRPAEIGQLVEGVSELQAVLFQTLRVTLDPDAPKPAFARLARISPPSRKVGAALRGSGVLGSGSQSFQPVSFALWRQTPEGFEIFRSVPLKKG